MSSWVQLTVNVVGNTKVWVNLALATHMTAGSNHTVIFFDKENKVSVKETPQQILAGEG
jgi:hypothetical protein